MSNELKSAPSLSPSGLSRRGFLTGTGVMLAGLGLAACTDSSESSSAAGSQSEGESNDALGVGKKKIVWALAAIADWNLPADVGFVEAASFLGWDYEKQGVPLAQYSPESVVNVVERAIRSGPDVLVTPGWEQGVYPALRDAKADGMTVMLNDANNFPDLAQEFEIPWVGQDEENLGFGLAHALLSAIVKGGSDSGTVVMGNPFPGNANLEQRLAGFRSGLESYNKAEGTDFTTEVLNDESGSDQAKSVTLYGAKFTELGDDLAGLVAVGGLVGAQAQQKALQERGFDPGEVPIGSIDVDSDSLALVREGWIAATVDPQVYQMGFLPPFLAAQALGRDYSPSNYLTQGLVVTSENIDDAAARQEVLDNKAKEYDIVLS